MPFFWGKKKTNQDNIAINVASLDAATVATIFKNKNAISRAIGRKNAGIPREYIEIRIGNNQILNDYDFVIKKIVESQTFIYSTNNKVYVLDLSKPDVKKYLLENIFPGDLSDHLSIKNNYPAFKLRSGDIYIKFPGFSPHQWSVFNKVDYFTRERYEQVKTDVVNNIDFLTGYTDSSYEVGKIEGYADNMTLTAMRQLAIKLYQDPENNRLNELGVLSRHIHSKETGVNFAASQHQVIQEKFQAKNQFKDIKQLYDNMLLDYKEQYSGHLVTQKKNPEFQKGAKMSAYASIDIPGFVPGMSREEMYNLFINSARILDTENPLPSEVVNLTPVELGALSYHIKAFSSSQVKIPEYNSNMSLKEVCMLYLQYVEKVDSTSDQLEALSYFADKAVARTENENILMIKGELEGITSSNRASHKIRNAMKDINQSFLKKQENHHFVDQDLIDFVLDDDDADQSSKNQPRPQVDITNTNNDGPKKQSILMPAEPNVIENQLQQAASSSDVFETPIVTLEKQIIIGGPDAPMNMLAHNPDSERLLANHEAQHIADAFQKASIALYQEHNIPTEYMPLIESITKSVGSPNKYEITFYDPNASDVNVIRKVETTKPIFMKTKQYLDRLTKTQPKINGNRIPAGTGLSVLFAIRILLASNDHSEWSRMNPLSHNLAKAVQLHNYFNLAGLGVGVLQDGLVIASMGALSYLNHLPPKFQADFKYLIRQENLKSFIQVGSKVGLNVKPLEQVLPRIMPVIEKVSSLAPKLLVSLGKTLPIANTIFNGGAVGFDIYQLAHAENSHQQKVFGAQLATSSICLGLAVGGTIAAYVGASSIAGPLFIVAIPVAVTGGAIVQAMQFYDNVEQLIDHQVLHYFDQVAAAYQKGYHYDKDTDTLSIASGAVVKKIDFENGNITLGSQYVCLRDKTDKQRVSTDNTTAINLRSALGGNEMIRMNVTDQTANILFLPDTPMSYVSYNTANIQAFSEYEGAKYDNIRRIERSSNGEFDLEHFSFLIHDNLVHKLFHQYKPTEVEVQLDGRNRVLIVPELPKHTAKVLNKESTILFSSSVSDFDDERNNNHQLETLSNAIHYNLTGKGGQYTIGLNEGATIRISSSEAKPSRWILNTNNLDKDDVEIHADKLIIGGVTVDIDPTKNSGSELIVVKQDGDVCAIDINSKCSKIIQMDAEKWGKKQPKEETFDAHLKKLVQEGRFSGEYIPVDNYSHGNEKVGRAYYDLKKDRMLFSSGAQIDGNLGVIIGENVYFYNKEHGCIWKVEASTGKVKTQYSVDNLADLVKDGMRIWQQNDQLYAAIDYTYNQGNKGEFIYNLNDDSIELVSLRINIKRAHIFKKISLLTFYMDAKFEDSVSLPFQFPNAKIINKTKLAPWVTIYDNDKDSCYRYWLRTTDKVLIKPDLPDMSADKALRLKFIGSIRQSEGSEIFYFLDPAENALYSQEGAEPQTSNPTQPLASRVNGNFISAEIVENNLFAVTNEGLIHQVGIKGDLALVAVNEQWLNKQGISWCQKLRSLSAGTQVMISGLRDKNGVLPAWCIDGLVVIAPALAGHMVLLLDVDGDGFARLFDSTTNRLYKQKGVPSPKLLNAFGDDHMLDDVQQLAGPIELLASQEFKSVLKEGNIIRLVTKEGVIIGLDHAGKLHLIGVDQAWQTAHVHDQSVALDLLAQNTAWSHAKVIVLQGATEHSTPAWYHVDLKLRIDADGLTVSDKPEFIGTINCVDGVEVYITNQKGGISCYNFTKSGPSNAYKFVSSKILYKDMHTQRLGEALLMEGADTADDLNPLVLDGVTSVILSGGEGEDTYSITEHTRKKIKKIIVNNYALDKAKDRLELYVKNINEMVLLRKDDDLFFNDQEGVVSLRNVFGDDKMDHNHLEVFVNDGTKQITYAVVSLVAQMENFQSNPSIIDSSYYLSEFNQN